MEVPPQARAEDEEHDEQWWRLLIVYTRDWIHYGAMAFYFVLAIAAAVRGVLSR
jgi:hypothetical protein